MNHGAIRRNASFLLFPLSGAVGCATHHPNGDAERVAPVVSPAAGDPAPVPSAAPSAARPSAAASRAWLERRAGGHVVVARHWGEATAEIPETASVDAAFFATEAALRPRLEEGTCAAGSAPDVAPTTARIDAGELGIVGPGRGQGIIVRVNDELRYALRLAEPSVLVASFAIVRATGAVFPEFDRTVSWLAPEVVGSLSAARVGDELRFGWDAGGGAGDGGFVTVALVADDRTVATCYAARMAGGLRISRAELGGFGTTAPTAARVAFVTETRVPAGDRDVLIELHDRREVALPARLSP